MSDAHLDDEALSAILDGEEPPSSHLDGCDSCRARSDELHGAALLIRAAVAPADPTQRESAIAAALDAHESARTRWRPPAAWLVAAALVLAIAALLPVLASHRGDQDQTASRDSRSPAPLAADSGAATESATAAPPTIDAGDLGTIDGELRQRITAALTAGQRASAAPETPFACDSEVRAMDDKAGNLALFGQATVNNRAGYVLVYSIIGSDPPRLAAYVVVQDSCTAILQFASFNAPSGEATTGTR